MLVLSPDFYPQNQYIINLRVAALPFVKMVFKNFFLLGKWF
jgi:hypothetical protein